MIKQSKCTSATVLAHRGPRVAFSVTALLMAVLLATAFAHQASGQQPAPGRYAMQKTEDGFVRLDTLTGAVSLCQKSANGWGCRPMDDKTGIGRQGPQSSAGSAKSGRSASLAAENAQLKAEVKRLEELLELRGGAQKYSESKRPGTFKLPTEREVDQALDYFESMLKKFQDRLKRLEGKSDKPERQL